MQCLLDLRLDFLIVSFPDLWDTLGLVDGMAGDGVAHWGYFASGRNLEDGVSSLFFDSISEKKVNSMNKL